MSEPRVTLIHEPTEIVDRYFGVSLASNGRFFGNFAVQMPKEFHTTNVIEWCSGAVLSRIPQGIDLASVTIVHIVEVTREQLVGLP